MPAAKDDSIFNVKPQGEREMVITRVFDAPRTLVFDALTKPEMIKRWLYGPDGWSLAVCEIDLRPGGSFRYVWRRESTGTEMGMSGVYKEIVPPERIVATEKFDQAWYEGDAVGTTVLAEEAGKTTLTQTMQYASGDARDGVMRSGANEGLGQGFERLADLLAAEAQKGTS
jgi:uncharacterized protein YndB with AHSA1/START domain